MLWKKGAKGVYFVKWGVQGLFVEDDVLPQVIVTNRDLALMNALKSVFPSSTASYVNPILLRR